MVKQISKNRIFRIAANEFAEKIRVLPSSLEIAITGSVADNDPYPNDLDLVLIVRNFDEIARIAKYARQMSKYNNSWEVFLFDKSLSFLGRICHRRECPVPSVDCSVPGCGQPQHVRIHPDFEYDENMFIASPIEVLWTCFETSRLLSRKVKLGIKASRTYPVLGDIEIECIHCGETFIFTGSEQKWFQKRDLSQPKRCPDCVDKERMDGSRDW